MRCRLPGNGNNQSRFRCGLLFSLIIPAEGTTNHSQQKTFPTPFLGEERDCFESGNGGGSPELKKLKLVGIYDLTWESSGMAASDVSRTLSSESRIRMCVNGHSKTKHPFLFTDNKNRIKTDVADHMNISR